MDNFLKAESASATAENWNNVHAALDCVENELAALPDDVTDQILDGLSRCLLEWLQVLMTMDAPDHAALVEKLRLFKYHDCGELVTANAMLDAMLKDAKRLGGLG